MFKADEKEKLEICIFALYHTKDKTWFLWMDKIAYVLSF